MLKTCFKCRVERPLSEFYKHKQMADGHLNKCKTCAKSDSTNHRNNNIESIREYDRKRGARQTPEYQQSKRAKHPHQYKAQSMVSNAIRDGKFKRDNACESCGSGCRTHGHHDDYAYPLAVRWLCPACHHQWHRDHGEAKNR
jgi:hypothetical protein